MVANHARQSRAPRDGVLFRGVRTGGFQGRGTEIRDLHGCPECHAAGEPLHPGCDFSPRVAALVDDGLAEVQLREGEWRAVLTPDGVGAFAGIHRSRQARAGRAASTKAGAAR